MPHAPNIAIIGAGPAGLAAAEVLGQAGCAVTIYDRKPSPARKFLMAGRGGLNLTHSEPLDDFLSRYGAAQSFMAPLIRAFTPDDLRAWCEELGQETFVGSSGRIFPKAMKASPLLRAWLARLDTHGIAINLGHTWVGWNDRATLTFHTKDGSVEPVTADAVLLALGGASWPALGSNGAWAPLLSASGIDIVPFSPANCGFTIDWSTHMVAHHAGQPLKNIRLSHGAHSVAGEIIITANGIEGGAVYALSAALRDAIAKDGRATLTIDLHPNISHDALVKKLSAPRGRQSFSTFLKKAIHLPPLSIALVHEADRAASALLPDALSRLIKAVPLPLTAPFGLDRAISSAGGIRLSAVDDNMMLKNIPGVFAAGEMLDWEAPTGGYLLQGCFATGRAAAQGMLRYLLR